MADEAGAEHRREINKKITIKALGIEARNELSTQLNRKQCLRNKRNNLYPDWRGLFEVVNLPERLLHKVANSGDHTSEIFNLWYQTDPENSTIEKLFSYLEEIDRYGLIEDIDQFVCRDIENFTKNSECRELRNGTSELEKYIVTRDDVAKINEGESLKRFDAFVLFADDDIDFATKLIETMESKYNMELCAKDRDIIPGDLEYTSIMTLITERCNRLIVILSPAFFTSRMHQFYLNYAHSYGVETQRTRVVLCVYKSCYSEMPAALKGFYMLDYTRAGKLWNFWDRLRDSLRPIDPAGTAKFLATRSTPAVRPDHRVTFSSAEIIDVTENEPRLTVADQNQNNESVVNNSSGSFNGLSVQETSKRKQNLFKVIQQKVAGKGAKTKKQGMEDNVCTLENPASNKSESLSMLKVFNVFKKDAKASRDASKKTAESKNKKKNKEKIAVATS